TPIKMPVSLRDKLAVIAPGIWAQESHYNENILPSSAGAQYISQIRPVTLADINRVLKTNYKIEDTKPLKVAAPLVFAYFDQIIYPTIATSARKTLEHFGLLENDEAIEQFITYCMVDAYNAGPTRMAHVMDEFSKRYSSRHIHEAYD